MIGDNLKRIRKSKNMGVNELSRMSGVNASYISALERNIKTNPSMDMLNKIAEVLEVSIDMFFGNEKNRIKIPKLLQGNIILVLEGFNINIDQLVELTGLSIIEIRNTLVNVREINTENLLSIANVIHFSKEYVLNNLKLDSEILKEYENLDEIILGLNNNFTLWISGTNAYEKFKESKYFETINENTENYVSPIYRFPSQFTEPAEARLYINMHQIFGSNGFDVNKISDKEVLNFANEMLRQIEMVSYKYKK